MPVTRHSLTRRNGQPQACEMCRKAKIRCDHETPQCGRCTRRSLVCQYHPAPLTRARPSPDTPRLSVQLSPKESPASEALQQGTQHWPFPPSPLSSRRDRPSASILEDVGTVTGDTQFTTMFSQHRASFVKDIMDVVEDDKSAKQAQEPLTDQHEVRDAPARHQLERGIKILREFPSRRTCDILLEESDHFIDVWLSPIMIRTCLEQVWRDYGEHLRSARDQSELSQVVADLDRNGVNPIKVDVSTNWKNWFGGSSIRWEMLSILFSFFGRAFKQREDWDPVFALPEQKGRDRRTAAEKMAECADLCLKMCDEAQVNDLVVCGLKNYWKLKSNILSDNSNDLQKGIGIVTSAFTSTFLHRLPKETEISPFSQYRASLASSVYYLDKCSSLFSGQPPLLTKKYCHCPMPLDLSEEELYGGSESLALASSTLDHKGWDKNGEIKVFSHLRAMSLLAPIKEQILELSLGVEAEFGGSTIRDISLQINNVEDSYPPQIQYRNIEHWTQSLARGRPGRDLYVVARIQLDVLRLRFLNQRLNVSRCHDTGQGLLDIAQEMMSVVLSVWLNRDHLRRYNYALNWIAVCYGIPCAGVLCMELVRAATATAVDAPTLLRFSKSEVIQSLTIYIAFLSWIRATDGNAKLCWKLRDVIKRIVDNVLDSTPAPTGNDPEAHTSAVETGDWDDLNWLNAIDWTQGDWIDLDGSLL